MNFELSTRAIACLGRGGRTIDKPDPLEVGQCLLNAGFPAFDANIASLVQFGGCWHPIGRTGTFKIFSVKDAVSTARLYGNDSQEPAEFRLPFGKHPTAQFHFTVDGNGNVYADSIPIHECVREWIEHNALMEMVERWKNCVRIVLPDPPCRGFANWANSQLKPEQAASSRFGRWWTATEWALTRFKPWTLDRSENWIWLFATNLENGELLLSKFRDSFGLDAEEVSEWP